MVLTCTTNVCYIDKDAQEGRTGEPKQVHCTTKVIITYRFLFGCKHLVPQKCVTSKQKCTAKVHACGTHEKGLRVCALTLSWRYRAGTVPFS